MHRYYTLKPLEFQAVLAIFTFFVDYADFYVNIIMLTDATEHAENLPFSTISLHLGRCNQTSTLDMGFASLLAKILR